MIPFIQRIGNWLNRIKKEEEEPVEGLTGRMRCEKTRDKSTCEKSNGSLNSGSTTRLSRIFKWIGRRCLDPCSRPNRVWGDVYPRRLIFRELDLVTNAFPSKAVQGKLDGYRISIDLFIEEAKVTRIPLPFNVSTIVTTRPITIKSLKKVERHSKFLNFYGGD